MAARDRGDRLALEVAGPQHAHEPLEGLARINYILNQQNMFALQPGLRLVQEPDVAAGDLGVAVGGRHQEIHLDRSLDGPNQVAQEDEASLEQSQHEQVAVRIRGGDLRPELPDFVDRTDRKQVTAGDFNHDGRTDLALATQFSLHVQLLLGLGDGTFLSPDTIANNIRARNADLVRTLTTYLEHGGNAANTATVLSVHRNTLKYRLQRVREISGYDLSDPDTAFNLQLAGRVWRMIAALRG